MSEGKLATAEGDDLVVRFDASDVQLATDRSFDLTLPAIDPSSDVFDFRAGGYRRANVSRSALLANGGRVFPVAPSRLADSNAVLLRARDLDDVGFTFAYARDVPEPAANETAPLTLTGWASDIISFDLQNVIPTANVLAVNLYMEAGRAQYWTSCSSPRLCVGLNATRPWRSKPSTWAHNRPPRCRPLGGLGASPKRLRRGRCSNAESGARLWSITDGVRSLTTATR